MTATSDPQAQAQAQAQGPKPRPKRAAPAPPPPAPKLTSEKLIPLLEEHDPSPRYTPDPELVRALVVLGPQEHDGRRFEAVGAHDGLPCRNLPLDAEGQFDPSKVRIVVR